VSSSAGDSIFRALVASYEVFLQAWPIYSDHNKERTQIGIELEFLGSHTSNPAHIDPSCRQCCRVRAGLYNLAEQFAQEINGNNNGNGNGHAPLLYDISHPQSVVCLPRYGHRSVVQISLSIRTSRQRSLAADDLAALDDLKRRLGEIGIRQH